MWDDWKIGPCSKSCGVGVRNVTRAEKIKAAYGGKECLGSSIVLEKCNFQECPGQKKRLFCFTFKLIFCLFCGCLAIFKQLLSIVNCEWTDWVISECSKTCGGGKRTKARDTKIKASHNGKECSGLAIVDEDCNMQFCPG